MHWCYQEQEALLVSIPVVGYYLRKGYRWYHSAFRGNNHDHSQCVAEHIHHIPTISLGPNHTHLTMEQVDQRFGQVATIFLMFDRKLLGTEFFPPRDEFVWLLTEDDHLRARWQDKLFEWDSKEWKELGGTHEQANARSVG